MLDANSALDRLIEGNRRFVAPYLCTHFHEDKHALIHHAMQDNVKASVENLKHSSQIIEHLIQEDGLLVVGATYSLETGGVEFYI